MGAPRISDETRDLMLLRSVVYRETTEQIAKATGTSVSAVSNALSAYTMVKEAKWDSLVIKAKQTSGSSFGITTIEWAEKATKNPIPKSVWDEIKGVTPEKPTAKETPAPNMAAIENKLDKLIQLGMETVSYLKAIDQDLPQIMTSITYLSKNVKETVSASTDPITAILKNVNENLIGVKVNTRRVCDLAAKEHK